MRRRETEARRDLRWSSKSPSPPRGPNSPVVGIHATLALVAKSRVSFDGRGAELADVRVDGQRVVEPIERLAGENAPDEKPPRKKSSAICRSLEPQKGHEPCTERAVRFG
jgi:hypothetical protein